MAKDKSAQIKRLEKEFFFSLKIIDKLSQNIND